MLKRAGKFGTKFLVPNICSIVSGGVLEANLPHMATYSIFTGDYGDAVIYFLWFNPDFPHSAITSRSAPSPAPPSHLHR